jgi:hypothetical protein
MVAQATESPADPSPPPANPYPHSTDPKAPPRTRMPRARHSRGGVRRLIASVTRIVNLQVQIWLTQAKLTLMKMALYAGLFMAAAVLGLLAIIFLYIGFFRLLTDVIGLAPVWAYLIYGALHLLLAGVLVLIATRIMGSKDDDDTKDLPKDAPSPAAP